MSHYKKQLLSVSLVVITIFIVIVGMFLIIDSTTRYKSAQNWKIYQVTNLSFRYPEEWQAVFCGSQREVMKLPKTISGYYDGHEKFPLEIGAYTGAGLDCNEGKLFIDSKPLCTPSIDIPRVETLKQLPNGLYIVLDKNLKGEGVKSIRIQMRSCTATTLFRFDFQPAPHTQTSIRHELGYEPQSASYISQNALITSPQYQDIKKFAESIKINLD